MKASDLFVKALEAEGVEYIFGIPGEENLDLLESLRTSQIKLVLTRRWAAATVSWTTAPSWSKSTGPSRRSRADSRRGGVKRWWKLSNALTDPQ